LKKEQKSNFLLDEIPDISYIPIADLFWKALPTRINPQVSEAAWKHAGSGAR
jgi:hypothetical protein